MMPGSLMDFCLVWPGGIDMHVDLGQPGQGVKERMLDCFYNLMPLRPTQFGVDFDMERRVQLMTCPAAADVMNTFHTVNRARRILHGIHSFWLNGVHHAIPHRLGGIPGDA